MLLLDSKIDILQSLNPLPVSRFVSRSHDTVDPVTTLLPIPESEKNPHLPTKSAGAKHKTIRQFSQISKHHGFDTDVNKS